MPQSSTTADCSTAVKTWTAAYKNFNGLPPSKDKAGTLYNNPDNMSFIALFTSSPNASAACKVVTCTEEERGSSDSRVLRSASALLCQTLPDVLSGTQPPFE